MSSIPLMAEDQQKSPSRPKKGKYNVKKYSREYLSSIGPTPWLRHDPGCGIYEVLKSLVLLPFVLPRLVLIFAPVVFIVIPFGMLLGVGHDHNRPLTPWKQSFFNFMLKILARWILFGLGFWWISIEGRKFKGKGENRPPFVISNHCGYLEILMYTYLFPVPAYVAKEDVQRYPVVGKFATMIGSMYVARTGSDRAAQNTRIVEALMNKAENWNGTGPQILLFPEGTATNGRVLLEFKSGVFRSGAPVQPVILKHPASHFNPVWEAINPYKHFIRLMLQFFNRAHVTILPVYHPTEEERADADLYAANVRQLIAEKGQFPLADGYPIREKTPWHDFSRFGRLNEEEYLAARAELRKGKMPSPPRITHPDGTVTEGQ